MTWAIGAMLFDADFTYGQGEENAYVSRNNTVLDNNFSREL